MSAKKIFLGALACASIAGAASAKTPSAIEQRLDNMEQTIEAQRAEIEALRAQTQQAAQEEPVVTLGEFQNLQQSVAEATANTKKATKGWWSDTKVSGRMYWDVTNIQRDSNGAPGSDNGRTGFDIKRFYIGIDHKFDDVFSGNITTDFQYSSAISSTELYIKKAYLEAKLSDALKVRVGSTDLPWVPFVEDLYGYRFVENTLIDRTKFGTSADWGLHASGTLPGKVISYAVAVVNGNGYKNPSRSDGLDVEGRISAKLDNVTLALGGYTGTLGKDVPGVTKRHDATRIDALAAYKNDKFTLGAEYFKAENWNNVTTVATDDSEGYGVFGSYNLKPKWAVFGRYDYLEPKQTTAPSQDNNYYNVGLVYSPAKIVDLSLVYKHEDGSNGSFGTSNGTVGGTIDGDYDEVGIFGQFRF